LNVSLFAVSLCFLLSGFAALIYQAAWLKKLAVTFGTSHIAVATVLAAYMAGLALGAALAARYVPRLNRPVLVYGVLEAVIGVTAIMVPGALDLARDVFVLVFGGQAAPVPADAFGQTFYYLIVTFLILSVPTGAMGATLPLLAKYAIASDANVGPRIGLLYGINTIGAVIGAITAGFLLLPYIGLFNTLLVGAFVNFLVFLIAVHLASKAQASETHEPISQMAYRAEFHWVMPIMLVSGVVSFTLEVLWTRLLSHVFGGTVYAFSIMLASFLAGIAIGGLLAGRLAKDREQASLLFIIAQLLIALLSWASYTTMEAWLPSNETILATRATYAFFVIFPSTLFIGATYPLAVRIATRDFRMSAGVSGAVYAWNTIGAISGALLAGFVLLPTLGFALTLKFAMTLSALLAAIVTVKSMPQRRLPLAASVTMTLIIVFLVFPPRPTQLIYSHVPAAQDWGKERYYAVGRSATILMREQGGFINLSSNGLSESSVGRKGMPPFNLSQKWLSGLPALARPNASSLLIVGYGGGVALEGIPPFIDDVDVVELEQEVINANAAVYDDRGLNPLEDPRVTLIVNDARNALMLTDKQYDIIVSQPSHPWTGGASHLYTSEFLEIAKTHLNEDGLFLQWINSQFVDAALLKTLMATLTTQFDYVELYQPERQVLLFTASDSPIDLWSGQINGQTAFEKAKDHYVRMGMRALEDAVVMMALDNTGLHAFSNGAPVNTDDHNRLAFFSRSRADGLTADSMLELFGDLDPLINPSSRLHGTETSLATHHIAEQLLQANFIQRTFKMARATQAADLSALIDGLGFDYSGETERAAQSFREALAANEENKSAQFGLLRLYLGDFARADVPPDIASLANRQFGPVRRVLEGWVFGAAGAFDRLKGIDKELAQVDPTSLAYPIAVKLRVDWRVVEAQRTGDALVAREALEILDDLLASYWSLDLYLLRAGCAYLAEDVPAFVESVGVSARQLTSRLETLSKERESLPPDEALALKARFEGMINRLSDPMVQSHQVRAEEVKANVARLISRL